MILLIRQVLYGFFVCLQALFFLFRNRMLSVMLIPLCLWFIFFILLAWSAYPLSELILEKIRDVLETWGWKNRFMKVDNFFFKFLIRLGFWYLGLYFSRYLAILFLGSYMSWLSEKTEKKLSPSVIFPARQNTWWNSLLWSLRTGTVYAITETLFMLVLTFLMFLLPFLSAIFVFMMFFLSVYFSGLSVMDVVLERYPSLRKDGFRHSQRWSFFIWGLGFFYWCMFSIPLLGFIMGPVLGTTLSSVGATLGFHRLMNETE